MRFHLIMTICVGLTACTAEVPNSTTSGRQGVGFDNYNDYLAQQRARDAALARGGAPTNILPRPETTAQAATGATQTDAEQTANAALAAIGQQPARPDASATLVNTTDPALAGSNGLPSNTDNADISDEQDFAAVSNRQSIQSDAQRRAQQSAQYRVIEPEALPSRPRGGTLTPIEFAVQTRHPVGQQVYRRSGNNRNSEANCAGYSSNELAQDAFLQAGGPERDKLRLDPDGDGYACGWSPAPYRNLARN